MKKELRLLTEILKENGLLSKVVEGYESRPQQLDMGTWILESFESARILLVEAPTGVGKTMAYLVPAALHARSEREPVVISSYTKALQDQIMRVDGPRLKRLVHPDLKLVALKGRSNYLCRRRWDLFVAEEGSGPDGQWVVDKLGNWVENTETGAFAEAPDLGPRGAWVYGRIGGHPRFCRSRLCRPDNGCFHKLARRDARTADLIIVNHSLLLADVFGGGILPEFQSLIIDEAHALPGAALDPLSIEVSERGLDDRIRSMGGVGEPGASDRLRRILKRLPSDVAAKNLNGQIREFEKHVREAIAASREFFSRLHQAPGFPDEGDRRRYTLQDCLGELMPSETESFLAAGHRLAKEGATLVRKIEQEYPGEVPDEIQDMLDATEMLIDELSGDIRNLESLIAPEDMGRVNVMASTQGQGASLSSIPLDPGPAIREHLLDTKGSVILTSATMATGEDFSYFSRQVGLEPGEPVILQLPSPFPLQKQLMVMTPTFAIDPREQGYAAFLSKTISQVAAEIGRKTLVLFTSYRLLQEVQRDLEVSPRMKGTELIVQSRSKPRSKVAEDFRAAEKAVLLGTASFWQGIDFPGKELEVLMVTRLPFPVPTDPRVEALSEAMEQEGRSSFREFSLPEAVLKMRQGIGRLIRRADDKGVCVILDPRLIRARYGNIFRAAMPVKPVSPNSPEQMLTQIGEWFDTPESNEPR
jgi:ATP-dependent DNA helicase DinG